MNKSELEAGRELDALVAEKVMGWTDLQWAEDFDDDTGEKYMGLTGVAPIGSPYASKDGTFRNGVPVYSTHLTDAMEVFEKLRQSGKWCCLNISSDYHYLWGVSLTESKMDDEGNELLEIRSLSVGEIAVRHQPTIALERESLPHAICLVALLAVEAP